MLWPELFLIIIFFSFTQVFAVDLKIFFIVCFRLLRLNSELSFTFLEFKNITNSNEPKYMDLGMYLETLIDSISDARMFKVQHAQCYC